MSNLFSSKRERNEDLRFHYLSGLVNNDDVKVNIANVGATGNNTSAANYVGVLFV